jgi:hypothetical protein
VKHCHGREILYLFRYCKVVIITIIDDITMKEYNGLYRRRGERRCSARPKP